MKLVEILARELKEWPEGFNDVGQASDGSLHLPGRGSHVRHTITNYTKASDWKIAIVTRADWEAQRARIAKPTKKANKDGWIRHRGGKCPVDAGTAIEYRERNGNIEIECEPELLGTMWVHENHPHDIMAYRLHKPAEQPASDSEASGSVTKEMIFGSASQAEGPLQWRDRITEIDRTVEALEEERASLVQRLEAEGFRLIERVVKPVGDMSDWRNWKVGDLAEVIDISTFSGGRLYVGQIAPIIEIDESDGTIRAAAGCWGHPGEDYKFHSRPSK